MDSNVGGLQLRCRECDGFIYGGKPNAYCTYGHWFCSVPCAAKWKKENVVQKAEAAGPRASGNDCGGGSAVC